MKSIAPFIFVLAIACVPRAPQPDRVLVEDGLDKQAIVGGGDTTITTHPWQISLQSSFGGHFCGGSIIDADWIVTAAHCVEGSSASSLRIVAGVTRRSTTNQAQIRSVAEVIRYPGYVDPSLGRDAALLRLSSPLALNGSTVTAIRIATPADVAAGRTAPGVNAIVTGWGALSEGGRSPDVLQAVTVPLVSNAQAQAAYTSENITSDQLGAGVIGVGGRDSCQGDSGGPLTVPDGSGGRVLAGVVSWGYGCADRRWPGMYSRVSSFASWIQGYVSPNQPPVVTLTAPANGATVSGNVTVSASASDSDGVVARVTFTFPDGSSRDDTVAPYVQIWDSTQFADGPASIRVQSFDDDGAASDVGVISVVTSNGNQSCASGSHPSLDPPTQIPDNNANGITSTILVNGSGTVTGLQLSLGITHTWRGDLAVQLVSPSGTVFVVHNRLGDGADDLVIQDLSINAFTSEPASGAWRLRIQDLAGQDVGTLDAWSLAIVADCAGAPTGGWSQSATPNLPTQDNGQVCHTVNVTGAGDAADVQVDLQGRHDWRSVLRGTLAHNGTTRELFPLDTFPRQGGDFGFTDRPVAGFSGSASGAWTICIVDSDAFGDTGTLVSWAVHD